MAAGEGQQVLALISKRLRALRKKNKRIAEMEESISQGKILNKDQEEILRSKPIVTALIEELEKLRLPSPPPSVAVPEEISLPSQKKLEPKDVEEDVASKKDVEEDVTAKKDVEEEVTSMKDVEDSTISDGVNTGEVSKDDFITSTSPAPDGSLTKLFKTFSSEPII
ncbi:hypothetical protein EUTSA_v10029189mg [Eutrema salsugineum]|uniref:Uncharacterized protein n=1 Tax=Eutrema salsugineum TaxID=72664 RepID=V4MZR7_EUTSA|nr:hypothetical protein EUTSA_v10029189mg [Eutrema salsugineum]